MLASMSTCTPLSPRHASSFPGYAGKLMLGLIAVTGGLMVWSAVRPEPPVAATARVPFNRLVHWRDQRHDWLLVADPNAHELVVYDATTGEPLRRLGAREGLGDIDALVPFGDRLLIRARDAGQPKLLQLPELLPVALAAR